MQAEPFYAVLRRILGPQDCSQVISALRQDDLVWNALLDSEVFQNCVKTLGGHASSWSPAAISTTLLHGFPDAASLQALPMLAISPEYRQLAARSYEDAIHGQNFPSSLEQAFILSLALRERRRLTGSWQGLQSELTVSSVVSAANVAVIWRTALSCLYGMIPDPTALLDSIACPGGLGTELAMDLILHILFSQPVSNVDRAIILQPLLISASKQVQAEWIEQLISLGRDELASLLASRILESEKYSPDIERTYTTADYAKSNKPAVFSKSLSELQTLRHQAELFRLSGQPEKSAYLLQQIGDGLRCIYSRILADTASSAATGHDNQNSLEYRRKSLVLAPELESNRTELAAELVSSGNNVDALEILGAAPSGLPGLIIQSSAAFQAGDIDFARQVALEAVSVLTSTKISNIDPSIFSSLPAFISLLNEVDQPEAAYQTAAWALQYRKTDAALLSTLSASQISRNQLQTGRDQAHLALALHPSDTSLKRNLAAAQELIGDWDQALEERKQILLMSPSRQNSDVLALAKCLLEAGKADESILACEEVSMKDPENGHAHAIQGEALYRQGKLLDATHHFTLAATLSPEIATPWLALAEIQEEQGEHLHALETLRSGSYASPQSAQIQHALAESCLQNGAPSEALPALRKAAQLDPKSARIAIRLGDILRSLGHLDESAFILNRALRFSPDDAELAYELAKTSIALNDKEQAIQALEIKLASTPTDPEPYILYTRLVLENSHDHPGTLETSCRLKRAEESLQQVLTRQADHAEAGILMAEVLTSAGRTEEALECYKALAVQYEDHSPAWSWRIKLGLGRVALDLDQIDVALAAMQEAEALNSSNAGIQKTLAETCISANLIQEALQAGNAALKLSGEDLPSLMWYASLACACGNLNDAISALEHAADCAGDSLEPHLRLAQIELMANNPSAARSALSAILHNTSTNAEMLQQAAHIYIQANDLEAAEECLLKATEQDSGVDSWVELVILQRECGQIETALETVRNAIPLYPSDPRLHILEADLLARLNRIEEGLACLSKVIPSSMNSTHLANSLVNKHFRGEFPPIPGPDLFVVHTDKSSVLFQEGTLLRSRGSLKAALEKFIQALELEPSSYVIRSQAVSTAHAMLDLDLAYSLVTAAVGTSSILSVRLDPEETADMLCAKAELEIDFDQPEAAFQSIHQAGELSPSSPRMLAIESYITALHGEFIDAEKLLETAIHSLDNSNSMQGPKGFVSPVWQQLQKTISYPTLSIAQAALQLHQWGLGFPLYEQLLRISPHEPRVHLAYARALVLAQEATKAAVSLLIKQHQPAEAYTGLAGNKLFDVEISAASEYGNTPVVEYWQVRGQAAYHAQGIESDLTEMLTTEGTLDLSALLVAKSSIYSTTVLPESIEVPAHNPEAMLSTAFALLPDAPEQSLTLAKNLAGQYPNHPLYQAAMAIIAASASDEVEGLQAAEQALQIWPDESGWHVLAAQLSRHCGDKVSELRHWELARQLAPDQLDYVLALGKAYLTNNKLDQGLAVLEEAVDAYPENSNSWLALAEACLAAGETERACTCAEKASILSPDRPEPRLISGQIALQAGSIASARKHAEAALERDPGESEAMLILVKTLQSEGHGQQALNFIEKSIPVARNPYPLQHLKAGLLKTISGSQAAIEALEALTVDYPREADLYKELAILQEENGMQEEAEQSAQAALRLQPYQPELHLLAGKLQRSTGQLDQAIYHLSECVHQDPELVEGYLELGKAYQDRHEFNLARNVYQQAMSAAPTDGRPYYQSALVLKEAKDYVGAENMLRKAAQMAPDDITIRRQLGAMIALNLVHNPMEAVK